MTLEHFVSNYGYWAVLVGAFLEGESIMLIGGFFAHQGYMQLPWVMLAGFGGSITSDQLFFYLGRRHGMAWLSRHRRWLKRVKRIRVYLNRHQAWLLIGFRFVYGMRNATPFAVGMSGFSPTRFVIYNLIGAAVWAIITGGAGYLFGQAAEATLGRLHQYEWWLALALVLIAGSIGVIYWLRTRNKPVPRS